MKKIFSSMLLLIAGAFIMTAQAVSYQMWIGGVQVNDDNKDDINPAGKTSGKILYMPDSKILLFQDVTMSTEKCCIDISVAGVTVLFAGVNNFTSTNATTFYADKPITLLGYTAGYKDARVTFDCTSESNYTSLFFANGGKLEISGMYLTLKSKHWSLYCRNDTEQPATLSTARSELNVIAGEEYPAVRGFDSWEMKGYGRLVDGATYDTSSKKSVNSNGEVVSNVTLKNALYVGDYMVSTFDIEGEKEINPGYELTNGTITYDGKNRQLVLRDVKYESDDYSFIDNCNIDGLEIMSIGTNNITCKGYAMRLSSNTLLSSTGILRLTSTQSSAISSERTCNVTVNMETLEAKGKNFGFFGRQGGTLTLKQFNDDAVYKFAGEKNANVYTGNLVMDGMDIWTNNTYFYDSYIRRSGGEIAATDNIDVATWFKSKSQFTYYPIYVAGTQVSSRNQNNIFSPYITSGTVFYAPSTKTLTLNGVQMEATGDDAPVGIIINTKDETTLNFTGADQNWTTNSDVILVAGVKGNVTITGNCNRVYLTSTAECGINTGAGTNITINTSGYFGAKGAKYGYYGGGATSDALTLHKDKSDIWGYVFEGAVGAIYNVKNLNLDNMDYSYNTIVGRAYGCYFDPDKEAVMQNGGIRAKGSVGFQSIKEALPISICGKQLNRTIESSYDIYVGSPYISSGPKSVAYNPKTKTLTLNDAAINCTDSENNAIQLFNNAEVTVNVKGDNNVKTSGSVGVWVGNGAKATFEGDGILDVKGRSWGIYTFSNSVTTIQGDLLLKATGDDFYCGIGCNNGGLYNESLVIGGNAVVNAINGIEMLGSLTLKDGQQVVEPAGAVVKKVDGKGWGVYESESSTAIARNVVIQPADYTGIQSMPNGQWSMVNGQWYDLSGRKVKNPSKGIFIQNGKKKLKN